MLLRQSSLRKSISYQEAPFFETIPRLFGFQYKSQIEPLTCLNKNKKGQNRFIASTPFKEKRTKGINVMCRKPSNSLVKIIEKKQVFENEIDKWCSIAGNKNKITPKLFRKMTIELVQNPQQIYTDLQIIVEGIKEYRPDFINLKMLNNVITFFYSYSNKKSVQIFRLTISLCSSKILLPFVCEDKDMDVIVGEIHKKVGYYTTIPSVYGSSNLKKWIYNFMIDLFKILHSIKESNPKGVCETIMNKIFKSNSINTFAKLIIMIVQSNKKNYESILLRNIKVIEIDLEEIRKFQKQ